MGRTVDYYFAPQSPWAYLGHQRLADMVQRHGATVRVMPIDLGGKVFPISGGLPLGQRAPQRQAYRLVELQRFAQHLNVPITLKPKYFPVGGDDSARLTIATDLALGPQAAMKIAGAILTACWAQERNMADDKVLAQLLAEQSLPASLLAQSHSQAVQERYESYTQSAIDVGVFGAPSYVVEGEIFWGQDRLDFVERALASRFFDKPKGKNMGNMTELISADGTRVPAYVAQPVGSAKGAVVVIQEIFGVNSHICQVADGYAAEGYVAVAPAMFHRVKPGVSLGYSADDMGEGFGYKTAVEALPAPGALPDIQAAIDHAAQASGGKVGIVGYCWGGLLTWRAACALQGLSAAVPYYGGGVTSEAETAHLPQVPVMAHFAEDDQWIPLETVAAFQKAHPGVQVFTYAAHHGFNCDQRGAWHAPSAQLARERSLAFLAQHLA